MLQEQDGDRKDVFLNIKKVNKRSFTKYFLTATNDLGSNTVTINLVKGSGAGKHNTPQEKPNHNDQSGNTPEKDNSSNDPGQFTNKTVCFFKHSGCHCQPQTL